MWANPCVPGDAIQFPKDIVVAIVSQMWVRVPLQVHRGAPGVQNFFYVFIIKFTIRVQ